MKPGGGKAKGAGYERDICRRLSLWVSSGKKQDLFWRSAMSGGRATRGLKRGDHLIRQAGDICAVAPEGHALTNRFYIECKFRRDLELQAFLLQDRGRLAGWWEHACNEAHRFERAPMLIAKQNLLPDLVITRRGELARVWPDRYPAPIIMSNATEYICDVRFLGTLLSVNVWSQA